MSTPGPDLPAPVLEHVARVDVNLEPPLEVGPVPLGRRRVIPIVGGTVSGRRLRGTILAGGADWQLVDATGTALIDTRYMMRTDDGSLVVVATHGFRHGPADVLAQVAAGEPVDPRAYYFRVGVRLETASEALAWVNQTVFIGIAARRRSTVSYDLYAVG